MLHECGLNAPYKLEIILDPNPINILDLAKTNQ